MRPGAQHLFPLLLMGLLAALTFWLARTAEVSAPQNDGRQRHDPDYLIEKFTVRSFNTSGTLQHTMRAERMTHYPDNDASELTLPSLTAYGGAAPIHVRAASGTVGPDGSVVVLRHDVRIQREAAPGVLPATFTTEEATLYPEDEYLTTAQPVIFTQGKSSITGTGFEFNNHTLQAVLHQRVRATYQQEKP
ncbi:MAG: export transporter periplasmic protein LptC [Pseudomonadota bacterium]|jgi:lipopolysaccharide export system protein LptC